MVYGINMLAVLGAAAASMLVGYVWYQRGVFGNMWMKALGKTRRQIMKEDQGWRAYFYTFLASLVTSYTLAYFIEFTGSYGIFQGMQVAAMSWLGFVLTTSAAHHMFEGKPRDLYIVNNGYQLFSFLVMGAILGMWV